MNLHKCFLPEKPDTPMAAQDRTNKQDENEALVLKNARM